MSQKPTGLKVPSKLGRPTGLPQVKSGLVTPKSQGLTPSESLAPLPVVSFPHSKLLL